MPSQKSTFKHLVENKKQALFILVILHISILAASNYFVQWPFEVFGIQTTWGAFTFPFVFLITDLTTRIFGAHLAKKIIFFVMFPALIASYIVSIIFFEGHYQGLSGLSEFNMFVFRIALASFAAYVIGQLLDVMVFNRLRQMNNWWVAPLTSTFTGNFIDALLFFSIAFYNSSDPFMSENWLHIAIVDYITRMIISTLFFLPAYGVLLKFLLKKLDFNYSGVATV